MMPSSSSGCAETENVPTGAPLIAGRAEYDDIHGSGVARSAAQHRGIRTRSQ